MRFTNIILPFKRDIRPLILKFVPIEEMNMTLLKKDFIIKLNYKIKQNNIKTKVKGGNF